MPVERKRIEQSLPRKGFVRDDSRDHCYFHHKYQGKDTGLWTFTSHGSHYKTYDESLLKHMKMQLGLDTLQQVRELFECPMSKEDYLAILRKKGRIPG